MSFYVQPTFHSNPAMLSASLGAAESKFSSLLALASTQVQLTPLLPNSVLLLSAPAHGHQGRNSSQGALGKALSNLLCSQC